MSSFELISPREAWIYWREERKRATKIMKELKHLTYEERLREAVTL